MVAAEIAHAAVDATIAVDVAVGTIAAVTTAAAITAMMAGCVGAQAPAEDAIHTTTIKVFGGHSSIHAAVPTT